MPEAVIIDGVRTPFVKAAGQFNQTPAPELGRLAVRELLYRCDLNPDQVDELVAGNVVSPPDAANVARVIALRAGIPKDRIAHTVSRNCASGMESVTEAVDLIESGRAKCVVSVGVDSMSNIPVFWGKKLAEKMFDITRAKTPFQKLRAIAKIRPSDLKPEIGIKLGLTDPVTGMMMGDTAEKLAREFHITREEQDEFALRSHQRAAEAWQEGRLETETMTVYPEPDSRPIQSDDGFRKKQSTEALGKLKPYFDRRWGTVTVGNSCQITDGATALLVMEAEHAKSLGLKPLGKVHSYAYAGCDPERMGLGPVFATAKVLKSSGLKLKDMQLIELNEAFAVQVLACLKCFESPPKDCLEAAGLNGSASDLLGAVDRQKLNVNGGAIALGHPVGSTGTRLILTLLKELERRDQNLGLATLCIGGGQGGAVIVERMQQAG